ncbi:MAG: NAD(P)/FAD-dependent oxidoreductase [Methylotenera sp.]
MRTDFDVIIVGAGPAGSSAAILLARAGWSVALIEKQRFPRRKVCGECIAASNIPLLEALGISPAFETNAGPELRKVALIRGDSKVVADLPAANHEKYLWGRALGRETLDTLLLEQARSAGAEVLQPWAMEAIDGKAGDWRCKVRAMDSAATLNLQAPVAIDAHGSWEALSSDRPRQSQARNPSDLFAFKANFLNASLEDGLLPILLFDGGYGGMVVADGGVTTVACCIRRDRLKEYRRASPGLRVGDMIEAMLKRECSGVNATLHGATRDGSWIAVGPLDPGIRLRVDDNLFRIGNAAGEAHPIIGEGISMALQSAWLLCVHLLNAKKDDKAWQREVGRRYTTQWRQHFVPRMRLAATFAHLAMRPASAASLMALASIWPGLLTLGARLGGKLHSAADSAAFNSLGSVMSPAAGSSATSSENFVPLKADLTQIT